MEKTVTVIPQLPKLPRRERVAAYARVSSGKDAMLHSLVAQVDYYVNLIRSNPMWIYAGVYADNAQTGTKANRPEFQRLLSDCRAGKIDCILVKSISRFARSTVTLLETVRELRSLGIDVQFEEESIHTLSGEADLILTVLASIAEAESKSVSDNCLWRIQKKFEQGEATKTTLFGYARGFAINPSEAQTVRRIFDLYLSGYGKQKIANILNSEGIPSPDGRKWGVSRIWDILQNEKYAGQLLLQKTYRLDHLSKKKVRNRGERDQYFVDGDHEAIVPTDIFEAAQVETERRYSSSNRANDSGEDVICEKHHSLSGKIKCGICGKSFKRKKGNVGPIWVCRTVDSQGREACSARRLPERVLMPALARLLSFSEEDINIDRIGKISVFPDGRLLTVVDGEEMEAHWANPSRRDSWTPEMKARAALQASNVKKQKNRWMQQQQKQKAGGLNENRH